MSAEVVAEAVSFESECLELTQHSGRVLYRLEWTAWPVSSARSMRKRPAETLSVPYRATSDEIRARTDRHPLDADIAHGPGEAPLTVEKADDHRSPC